jgi:thiol-disulfide isomerase/thioredoxin
VNGLWTTAFVSLSILTFTLCVLFLALARYVAALAARVPQQIPLELSQGPEVGSQLSADSTFAIFSEHLAQTPRDRVVVAFLSTTCVSCRQLAPELQRFARDYPEVATFVVISGQTGIDQLVASIQRAHIIRDETGGIARAFGVGTVPFALFYEHGSLVVKGVVNNRGMLEALMERKVRQNGDELLALAH